MLGETPELDGDLEGTLPRKYVLLLQLGAYGNVTRKGERYSIFGGGTFYLSLGRADLKKGALDEALFLFG